MKYVDEFRDRKLIDKVAAEIRKAAKDAPDYNFMEVCGGHTMSICRFGLRDLLPKNINLMSGPGCPVCVTPNVFVDKAVALANLKDVIIATFGDMLKVPGSYSSLEDEKAGGRAVKMVYSTTDALDLAKKYPNKEIVFLGIGFETTAPTVSASILMAKKEKIKNYSVLSSNKTMPEALEALVKDKGVKIDGFILPGHVSAIIGTRPYRLLSKVYKKRCVVSGFEPLDILESVLMLVRQDTPDVEAQYKRIINRLGNALARKSIETVFEKADSQWRGIGLVKKSGLRIRKEYSGFDAEKRFNIKVKSLEDNPGCACGDVLKGIKTPLDCKLYAKVCNPENPVGACMVSSEGTCAAYYKYNVK